MTFDEIMDYAVEMTDEDESIKPQLKNPVNEGLKLIALNGSCPVMKEEAVTPDTTKFGKVSFALPTDFFSLENGGVYDSTGKRIRVLKTQMKRVFLDTGSVNAVVLVYACVPPRLTADDDVPAIPEALHEALACYAAHSYLMSVRKEQRAAYLKRRFDELVASMEQTDIEDEEVQNPYA